MGRGADQLLYGDGKPTILNRSHRKRPSRPRLTVVYTSDWQGLYKDDDLIVEDHNLDILTLLKAAGISWSEHEIKIDDAPGWVPTRLTGSLLSEGVQRVNFIGQGIGTYLDGRLIAENDELVEIDYLEEFAVGRFSLIEADENWLSDRGGHLPVHRHDVTMSV